MDCLPGFSMVTLLFLSPLLNKSCALCGILCYSDKNNHNIIHFSFYQEGFR